MADETDQEKAPRVSKWMKPSRRNTYTIAFDPRSLRQAVVIVLVGILVFQIFQWTALRLSGFLFNILVAWLLAISFDPLVSGLARRGMPRALATTIVATSIIGLVTLFLFLFGGALARQAASLVLSFPLLIADVVGWLNANVDANIDPADITASLNLSSQDIADIAGPLAGGIIGAVVSVFGVIFSFTTVLVFSFYFSASAPQIKRFLASWLTPRRQVIFIDIWDIAVSKAGGYVISKLALASIASVVHVTFFWLIGVPYWLPVGIFAGFVSQFIPTVGTYIGILLPILFAAFNDPLDVVWIIIFATVYQQIENYLLTPRISTATMDINSGLALASVFIGAALFGPMGAIIGIPVAAIIIAVIEAYGRRYELHPELDDRI